MRAPRSGATQEYDWLSPCRAKHPGVGPRGDEAFAENPELIHTRCRQSDWLDEWPRVLGALAL
jgi:hypothetical protein